MFRKLTLLFAGFYLVGYFCYSQENKRVIEHRYRTDLSTTENPGYWINMDTRKQDTLPADNFYSAVDSSRPYGLGFEVGIPDDLKKKNLYLTISARLRIADSNRHILLVTDIRQGDSTVIWKGLNVAEKFGKAATWVPVRDSLMLPANLSPDSKIKIYIWNQDGNPEIGFDDLDIRFTVPQIPSYLVH